MSNQKSVCVHIITKLELGGAQDNTLYTLKSLPSRQYKKFLISGSGGIRDEEARNAEEYTTYFVPRLKREIRPLADISTLFRIRKLLIQIKPTIVHTHSSKAGILGRWAAYLARVPVIVHTFHGFGFNDYQHPLKRWFLVRAERFTARITTAFIAVSRDNIETALGNKIGKPRMYSLIHSGIHRITQRFDARTIRHEIGMDDNELLIYTISCLKLQKNVLDFARLAKLVSARNPDIPLRFVVAGDGEQRPMIEKYISENGLKDKLILLGWRRDATELLAAADIYVMTSLWEGLPRALLEAMALGKPCCVYAADGVKDVVRNGENGYIVPVRDLESLADYVDQILKNKHLRSKIGEKARKSVIEEHFIDTMVKRIGSYYQGLLEERGLVAMPTRDT
jgi:glycosyltransferase involved in cell wall biosynthesis